MTDSAWRPLGGARQGAEAFEVTPFARLARAHVAQVGADTLVAIALAGTLFFSIDVGEARGEVFLYLALTMAPFSLVAPLVGPALDRAVGGRRWMVIGAGALRAVVCLVMMGHVDSLLLFPEAFALLVLAKAYHVAKSALVPTVVQSDGELVQANSKLALISGIVGAVVAGPGAIALQLAGAEAVLALASLGFGVATLLSWQIPKVQVASAPETVEALAELRGAGVRLAASAMALLRGAVGFLTFLLAFGLRTEGAASWQFGLVLGVSALSAMGGAAAAPPLRSVATEERMITGALVVVTVAGFAAWWVGGLAGAVVVASGVGVSAACAKQAFDAIVQRDAPDANRGRSFARFETRFQLVWVAGAVGGVLPIPMWSGFLVIGGLGAFGMVSYFAGTRTMLGVADRTRRRHRDRRRGREGAVEDGSDVDEADPTAILDHPPPAVPPTIVTPPPHQSPGPDDPTTVL